MGRHRKPFVKMPDYKIRAFSPDLDNPKDIAKKHLEIREWQVKEGQARFTKGINSSQKDLKNLNKNYLNNDGNFFLAFSSINELVGFAGIKKVDAKTALLKRVAVSPESQRKGVASLLLSRALSWAKQKGYKTIKLSTGLQEKGKPLYEKFGFIVTGIDLLNNDYLMELDLNYYNDRT